MNDNFIERLTTFVLTYGPQSVPYEFYNCSSAFEKLHNEGLVACEKVRNRMWRVHYSSSCLYIESSEDYIPIFTFGYTNTYKFLNESEIISIPKELDKYVYYKLG